MKIKRIFFLNPFVFKWKIAALSCHKLLLSHSAWLSLSLSQHNCDNWVVASALLINQRAACGAKRFKWPLKSIGKVSVAQLGCDGGGRCSVPTAPACPRDCYAPTTFPIKSDWANCQRELCAADKNAEDTKLKFQLKTKNQVRNSTNSHRQPTYACRCQRIWNFKISIDFFPWFPTSTIRLYILNVIFQLHVAQD